MLNMVYAVVYVFSCNHSRNAHIQNIAHYNLYMPCVLYHLDYILVPYTLYITLPYNFRVLL